MRTILSIILIISVSILIVQMEEIRELKETIQLQQQVQAFIKERCGQK